MEDIHFELVVATDPAFDTADILFTLTTLSSTVGWSYEGQPFVFVQFPSSGFPSNFSGRRVKFVAQEAQHLRLTEIYYVRWTAVNSSGVEFFPNATAAQKIIISA